MKVGQVLKRWILPSGTAPRKILSGILHGLKFELDPSYQTQVWLGLQERELYPIFNKLSKGVETAICFGAANGFDMLFFLHKTSVKKVIAFEPQSDCRNRLNRNLKLNSSSPADKPVLSNRFVGRGSDCIELDHLEVGEGPCVIKIDTEGAEKLILGSGTKLLDKKNARWIVETHSAQLEKDCLAIFQGCGYKTEIINPAWWRVFVPDLRTLEHNRWLIAYRLEDKI